MNEKWICEIKRNKTKMCLSSSEWVQDSTHSFNKSTARGRTSGGLFEGTEVYLRRWGLGLLLQQPHCRLIQLSWPDFENAPFGPLSFKHNSVKSDINSNV